MDHRATANKETLMGSSSAATMETTVLSRDVSRGHLANLTKSAALAVGGLINANNHLQSRAAIRQRSLCQAVVREEAASVQASPWLSELLRWIARDNEGS